MKGTLLVQDEVIVIFAQCNSWPKYTKDRLFLRGY